MCMFLQTNSLKNNTSLNTTSINRFSHRQMPVDTLFLIPYKIRKNNSCVRFYKKDFNAFS